MISAGREGTVNSGWAVPVLLAAMVLTVAGPATRVHAQDPGDAAAEATLSVVDVHGLGCRAGQSSVETAPDGRHAAVRLTHMVTSARSGPLTCEIDIAVTPPARWMFRLAGFWSMGTVETGRGVRAKMSAYGRIVGEPARPSDMRFMSGPKSSWRHHAELSGGAWTGCDGPAETSAGVVNDLIWLPSNSSPQGTLGTETILLSVDDLEWQRCSR